MTSAERIVIRLDPDTKSAVLFNLRQSFFLGIPRVFTISAASAIFLDHFSASDIPFAYCASALAVIVLGLAFLKCEKRVGNTKNALIFVALMGLTSAGFAIALGNGKPPLWTCFGIFLWAETEWTLCNVTYWSVANRSFNLRDAKRLFGIVSAGEIIPMIIGGAMVPIIVGRIDVANLLFFSVAGHALAFINLMRSGPKSEPDTDGEQLNALAQRFSLPKQHIKRPYVYRIAMVLGFNCMLFYFVDNIFLSELKEHVPESKDLAAFMGIFVFASGVFQLLAKLFISGRITNSWGIRKTLLSTPIVLTVLMISLCAVSIFGADTRFVFYLIIACKLLERTMTLGINSPAYYVLFQPLPENTRARIQGFLDTIIAQVSSLFAAGILIVLQVFLDFDTFGITAFGLALLPFWIWAAQSAGTRYSAVLRQLVHRRQIDAKVLTQDNNELRGMFEEGLHSEEPTRIVYSFKLLEQIDEEAAKTHLLRLFANPDEQLRAFLLDYFETLGAPEDSVALRALISATPHHQVRKDAVIAIAACDSQGQKAFLETSLNSADEHVRAGAIIGLLRYANETPSEPAEHLLLQLTRHQDGEKRVFAAHLIGRITQARHMALLKPLLSDSNRSVRRAAILAAGQLRHEELWHDVLKNIDVDSLRSVIANALTGGGDPALSAVRTTYDSKQLRWSSKRGLLEIAGRIGGQNARAFLLGVVQDSDLDLRAAALGGLSEISSQDGSKSPVDFRKLLREEAQSHFQILCFQRDLLLNPHGEAMNLAISDELLKSQARIYLLLENIYERDLIASIRIRMQSTLDKEKALALELLETSLKSEDLALVMPILECLPAHDLLSELAPKFAADHPQDWAMRLVQIISEPLTWKTTWLVNCARAAAGVAGLPLLQTAAKNEAGGTQSFFAERNPSSEIELVKRTLQLQNIEYFKGLTADRLATLCAQNEVLTLEKGSTLLPANIEHDGLILLLNGKLSRGSSQYPSGTAIGEFDPFAPHNSTHALVASEKSEIIQLDGEQILSLVTEQFQFAWHLLQLVCTRLQPNFSLPRRSYTPYAAPPSHSISTISEKSLVELLMLIRAVPLFQNLDNQILSDIICATKEMFFDPQEQIFRQGEQGTSMLILLSGDVRVHAGNRVLAEVAAPNIIGEMAAITANKRSATVTAMSPVYCLMLDQVELYSLLWRQNDVIMPLLELLSERFRDFRQGNQYESPFMRNINPPT